MMNGFKNWLAAPYSENMSAYRWFLFFGLAIVLVAMWRVIFTKVSGIAN